MRSSHRLPERVATRLAQAEACEVNAHYRDDLRIARLTVLHAARGDAVRCSPFVLSSYEVLGLHPSKVWPKILERRNALGIGEEFWRDLPPKKPPVSAAGRSHEKLWFEKTNGARAANSRAGDSLLRDNTISVPMAAPSIAALYPNPDAPSSAKKRQFTLDELKQLIYYSGAPHAVRALTLSALEARGPWPNEDGPATSVLCISLKGMMIEGGVCRSTAQRRVKRACKLGFWRRTREANTWSACPKCSTPRDERRCDNCGYQGSTKNRGEFVRPFTYEFDVQRFLAAPRCREIHSIDWRTYAEYKAAARRGEHPNVTEMPRKPAQPDPGPKDDPPTKAAPVKQPAAEHIHRGTARPEPQAQPKLTKRDTAKLVADVITLSRGHTRHTEAVGGYAYELDPADPRYRPPLKFDDALAIVCDRWHRSIESVREALKFWGYKSGEFAAGP